MLHFYFFKKITLFPSQTFFSPIIIIWLSLFVYRCIFLLIIIFMHIYLFSVTITRIFVYMWNVLWIIISSSEWKNPDRRQKTASKKAKNSFKKAGKTTTMQLEKNHKSQPLIKSCYFHLHKICKSSLGQMAIEGFTNDCRALLSTWPLFFSILHNFHQFFSFLYSKFCELKTNRFVSSILNNGEKTEKRNPIQWRCIC